VTIIENNAFYGCDKLTSISFASPTSITSIGARAFWQCFELTSLVIPSSVTNLGFELLADCQKLTSIRFEEPSSLTTIRDLVFTRALSIPVIIIPSSVTSIGDKAFYIEVSQRQHYPNKLTNAYFMGAAIPSIATNNFSNVGDTAYYLQGATNASILDNFFTTKIPLDAEALLAAAAAALAGAAAAPAAPTITSITSGDATASIAFITRPDNGSPITNYQYSLDDGTNWITRSPVSAASPIVVSNLTNSQSYSIKIKAVNALGSSPESNALSVVPSEIREPDVPTITGITPGNRTASITFTAGAANGSAITNYQYSRNGGSTWIIRSPVSAVSPITISGLTNGQTYSMKIKAINAIGSSIESNALPVVPAAAAAPAAPTITGITEGNAAASIAFTAGAANGSAIITYKYAYSSNGGTSWSMWTPRPSGTTASPIVLTTYLLNDITYSIKIIAINALGSSIASNIVSVTPTGIAPAAPIITGITGGNATASIAFTASAANGSALTTYQYSSSSNAGESWSEWTARSSGTTASPLIATYGLNNGTTYSIRIRAVNAKGSSPASNVLSVVPATTPDAPTITSITAGDKSAIIDFTANANNGTDITNYKYAYSINGGSSWTTIQRSPASVTSPLTISGLKNGQEYSIKIMAVNAKGTGITSNILSVTPVGVPAGPKITSIIGSNQTATINFITPFNNGSTITNYQYSTDGSTNWITFDPSATASPIVVSSLTNGQTYSFKIKAINDVGNGLESNALSVKIPAAPAAPTITGITSSISFTPGAANGSAITNYKYSTDGGANWIIRSPVSILSPLVITGLTSSTIYPIQIKAINAIGDSL